MRRLFDWVKCELVGWHDFRRGGKLGAWVNRLTCVRCDREFFKLTRDGKFYLVESNAERRAIYRQFFPEIFDEENGQ